MREAGRRVSTNGRDPALTAVVVPIARLQAGLLRRVVEEFVTRDGTDYGAVERTLPEKVHDVMAQLERGDVVVVYDPETDTTTIVPRQAAPVAP